MMIPGTRTIAPNTRDWRSDVVPPAAVFVIRHNDESVLLVAAVLVRVHKISNMLLSL